MIIYLIKSILCLALLLAFYYFFLEKERMHWFNRFYLIGSVLFALSIPLINIHIDGLYLLDSFEKEVLSSNEHGTDTWVIVNKLISPYYLLSLYLLISGLFLFRFLKHMSSLQKKIRTNKKEKHNNAIVVLLAEKVLPFSFLNYIFVSKKDYQSDDIEEEILTHEYAHVTQKHTLDILFIELLQIIFWINPFLGLLKKAVRVNHEFLADQTVVESLDNIKSYQYLMLNVARGDTRMSVASSFNHLITKKRLIMMTKTSSATGMTLRKLMLIPLLAVLTFLFTTDANANKEHDRDTIETSDEHFNINRKTRNSAHDK